MRDFLFCVSVGSLIALLAFLVALLFWLAIISYPYIGLGVGVTGLCVLAFYYIGSAFLEDWRDVTGNER